MKNCEAYLATTATSPLQTSDDTNSIAGTTPRSNRQVNTGLFSSKTPSRRKPSVNSALKGKSPRRFQKLENKNWNVCLSNFRQRISSWDCVSSVVARMRYLNRGTTYFLSRKVLGNRIVKGHLAFAMTSRQKKLMKEQVSREDMVYFLPNV